MRSKLSLLAVVALLSTAVVVVTATPAPAAVGVTFTVDKFVDTTDVLPGDGVCDDGTDGAACSLRAAVMEANASPDEDDTIELPDGTQVLSIPEVGGDTVALGGDLDVVGKLTIEPAGVAPVTIVVGETVETNNSFRHFDVRVDAELILTDLSLVYGGALGAAGDPAAVDNSGGSVLNRGRFTATNVQMSFNKATRAGGAIEALGGSVTTLTNVGVALNNALGGGAGLPGNGGGLHTTAGGPGVAGPVVKITGVSGGFTLNSAANEGGGIWLSSDGDLENTASGFTLNGALTGGGIFNNGGDVTVDFSGFVLNTATGSGTGTLGFGGGILNLLGTVTVTESTFTLNGAAFGGGIATAGGTADITDSDMVFNFADSGGGIWKSASSTMTVDAVKFELNVARGVAPSGGGGVFSGGVVLEDDATSDGLLTIENSEFLRNTTGYGGGEGDGAAILHEGGPLTVMDSTLHDNLAARHGGGIAVRSGVTTIERTSLVDNRAGITIPGEDFEAGVEGPGNGGGLHLAGDAVVDMSQSFVTGNDAENGGGLWNSAGGTMSLDGVTVAENVARAAVDPFDAAEPTGGGGVFNEGFPAIENQPAGGGSLTISQSRIFGNTASSGTASGGGVLSAYGDLTVTRSEISGNDAVRAGGGVEIVGGAAEISGTEIAANHAGPAPGNGGGLHVTGAGDVDIVGSEVHGNTADNEGGGLWNSSSGVMTVTDSTIFDNEADETN